MSIQKKLITLSFYFIGMTVFAIIFGLIFVVLIPENDNLVGMLLNLAVYLCLLIGFFLIVGPFYLKEIKNFKKNILLFIFIAVAGWFAMLMINFFSTVILELLGLLDSTDTSENQKIIEEGMMNYAYLLIPATVIFAPIVEETVFRGVIFDFFRKLKLPAYLNVVAAFLVSSLLFGAIHLTQGELFEIVPYAGMGVALALVYFITNNIWAPIITHFIQNLFATIMMLLVTWFPNLLDEPTSTLIIETSKMILHLH